MFLWFKRTKLLQQRIAELEQELASQRGRGDALDALFQTEHKRAEAAERQIAELRAQIADYIRNLRKPIVEEKESTDPLVVRGLNFSSSRHL